MPEKQKKVEQKPAPKETVDVFSRPSLVDLISKYKDDLSNDKTWGLSRELITRLKTLISESELKDYSIAFLFQDTRDRSSEISAMTLSQIYSALKDNQQKILLILNSLGGQIEPAYQISKFCKEKSQGEFSVAVARQAKSAATLISLGADFIHMGSISELGPIDPQIDRLPAIALGEAVKYLTTLSDEHPKSQEMLASYLSKRLDLRILGYMERVADSAVDYAERLLDKKQTAVPRSPREIGEHLVRKYKDHGFVIDKDEATKILGNNMVKIDTPEYQFASRVNEFFETVKLALWIVTNTFYYIDCTGDIDNLYLSKNI